MCGPAVAAASTRRGSGRRQGCWTGRVSGRATLYQDRRTRGRGSSVQHAHTPASLSNVGTGVQRGYWLIQGGELEEGGRGWGVGGSGLSRVVAAPHSSCGWLLPPVRADCGTARRATPRASLRTASSFLSEWHRASSTLPPKAARHLTCCRASRRKHKRTTHRNRLDLANENCGLERGVHRKVLRTGEFTNVAGNETGPDRKSERTPRHGW